jgi:hypothetical protein
VEEVEEVKEREAKNRKAKSAGKVNYGACAKIEGRNLGD